MPREHLLFNFRGDIGTIGLAEHWSIGVKLFRVAAGELPETPVAQSTVDDAADAFRAYFTDSRTGIHSTSTFKETRAWFIGEDGKSKHPVTTLHLETAVVAGGSGGTLHPFQVACKVSLGAGHNRQGSRGGWYLPTPAATIDQLGQVTSTFASNCGAATQDFVEAMENLPDFDPAWVVGWPSSSPNNPDGWAMAERIAVGRVLDTMRSRRRDLDDDLVWAEIDRSDD